VSERAPYWAYISMGVTIAAVQGLLIRLLLVSFAGNELSIGLILANWMLAEALGSNAAGRLASRLRHPFDSFLMLQVGFALLLPLVVVACYLVRRLAGVAPGEALDLWSIVWTSLLLLAPLSAIHGAMFSVGASTYGANSEREQAVIGRLYACEALGAMCGGVMVTFLFIPHLKPTQTAMLLSLVGLLSALLLVRLQTHSRRRAWMAIVSLVSTICLYLLLSPQVRAWHDSLVQLRWGGVYDIVHDRDSPYGNIAVTQLLGQYTFLVNGTPMLTTPLPDVTTVEETVHLPLLFHPHPQRALVIGGGLGGISSELLKYSLESIDYAELDPVLIEAVRAFPTGLTERELQDERLRVHSVDGRLLLNRMRQQGTAADVYDVALVNLPYPSTLELNRFYTEDFLLLIRQVLDRRGLAVFTLPGSLTYIGPGMRDLNLMLQSSLQIVFENVRPIPGDTVFWLASPSLPLTETTPEQLVSVWQQRALPTQFITTGYLWVRFDQQRLSWFRNALDTEREVLRNQDLHPAGVLYGIAYWSEMFAPTTYHWLTCLSRITLWQWCLLPVLLSVALWLAGVTRSRRGHIGVPIVVTTSGFSGMVCDLMVVFVFQIMYGYVYQYIGLIIAFFMAGLAFGGWVTTRKPSGVGNSRRALVLSEIALIVFWAALPSLFAAFTLRRTAPVVTWMLLLLNGVGGLLVGLQFPLSSQLHLSAHGAVSHTAGVLYAADLVGAFFGAIAVGIALLPALGATGTCFFVVALKLCSLLLFITQAGP
jgi:spermidine synthase